LYLNPQDSVEQLKAGKIDAAFFVADIRSAVIRVLLEDQKLSLFNFERAEAYSQVLPFLSKVTLHEGIVDFKNNIRGQAVSLIAPTANLVVHEGINKSLAILLLQSMEKNHSNNSLFSKQGFFPTEHLTAFPASDVAKRFLEVGPPFLMKYLPFWVATFIDRMIVLLLPLLLLILPLFKLFPPLYRWRIRSKVYRWYEQLQKVDDQTHVTYLSEQDYDNLNEEINRLSEEVSKLNTPLSNTDQIYNLLMHIDLVKKIIQEKKYPPEAHKQ
ncbi:MAG: hypothetical protein KAI17_21100, partial [Thiotrichaceae bacterium]|nr:hypothetical protein [Thiotrichaceae bacterium]